MTKEFVYKLAKMRADEIFTKDYFQHVTDSWYLDEKFRFEDLKVGPKGRKPTQNEASVYMVYLADLFDEYREKFYANELAQDCYGKCIDSFDKIFKYIEFGNKNYSQFNIDEDTIKKLKNLANIFVYKHNEFCKNAQ